MCVCVSFLPPIYIPFSHLGESPSKPLSLSFLHRHRALAAFTARVKPTMGAVAAFAAHASSRRIFFTGALLPRRKSHGVRNLGTRVRDSAGKNDRANEEEEEERIHFERFSIPRTRTFVTNIPRKLHGSRKVTRFNRSAQTRRFSRRGNVQLVILRRISERGFHPHALQSVGKRSARAMHAPGNADSFRRRERERVVADSV